MKIRRLFPTLIALAATGAGAGCALLPSSSSGPAALEASGVDDEAGPMDQARLEMLFAEHVEAITGPPGAIETVVDGIQLYCISDAANDRMRFVAPIARASTLDPRVLPLLLQANFHSTLDARYSISEDVVFATFLHPISSLTPELVESGMAQVLSLVQTFGTSFSAGGVIFAPTRPEER
jgi:hypothetical protein